MTQAPPTASDKEGSLILKDPTVLTPRYEPDRVLRRTDEKREIRFYLDYLRKNALPPHLLIVGSPGSGKTLTIKHISKEYAQNETASITYVQAIRSPFITMRALASQFSIEVPRRGISAFEIWSEIQDQMTREAVIVIDEINVLLSNDGGCELISDMVRDEHVCVIGVTNNIMAKESIENHNLHSVFKPRVIEFAKYDANELKEILTYWAELAFDPGALSDSVLPLVAAFAARTSGDARYAIDLLARSAELCIKKECSQVLEEHVREAEKLVFLDLKMRAINQLTPVQKQILKLAVNSKTHVFPDIYKDYVNAVRDNKTPLTRRMVSYHITELEKAKLVEIEIKGRGFRNGKVSLVHPMIDKGVIEELDELENNIT